MEYAPVPAFPKGPRCSASTKAAMFSNIGTSIACPCPVRSRLLPRGQAGARFEHAAFDRRSVSDLLGERRLGGAVDAQVQGLRHADVVHYYFASLVLFLA